MSNFYIYFLLYYYFYGYGFIKEYHAAAKDINRLFSQTDIYLWLKVRGIMSTIDITFDNLADRYPVVEKDIYRRFRDNKGTRNVLPPPRI